MRWTCSRWMAGLGFFAAAGAAQAQDFAGCVPASEGQAFAVTAAGSGTKVQGVVLGSGGRGVVFSNTAYDAPCEWLPTARELAAKGFQVALWRYGSGGLGQMGELSAVVAELRRRGAARVALVGGSRGGCLSMMGSSEIAPPVAGVVMLSCAAVFNRRDPTPTAPWAAKLQVPVLHVMGEHDPVPTLAEAREEFDRFPVADKRLVIVPGTGAHGDQLLSQPAPAGVAKPAVMEFLDRVTR